MQGIPQGQNQNSGGTGKPSLTWQTPAAGGQKATPPPATKTPSGGSAPKISADKSNTGTFVVIFVAGLVVGVLLGWAVAGRSGTSTTSSSTPTGTDTGSSTMTTTGAPATGEVVVAASQPAGTSVAVSKADVSKPTWVVVYDNNNGAVGHALGATLFFPASMNGETSGTIDLLRPTVAGTTYLVGQLLDDGDPNLSFSTDKPIVDSNGKAILMTLTAQ